MPILEKKIIIFLERTYVEVFKIGSLKACNDDLYINCIHVGLPKTYPMMRMTSVSCHFCIFYSYDNVSNRLLINRKHFIIQEEIGQPYMMSWKTEKYLLSSHGLVLRNWITIMKPEKLNQWLINEIEKLKNAKTNL